MEREEFNKTKFRSGDRMILDNGEDHLIASVDFETGFFESADDGLVYPMKAVSRIYYEKPTLPVCQDHNEPPIQRFALYG